MTYSRDDGTTTPTYAGLCEFGGLRINDGTFKSETLPMITAGPPRRDAMASLPSDDGGIVGDPFLDWWAFEITAWMRVNDVDDVWTALSDIRSVFTPTAGFQQLVFKARGWAQRRFLTARVAGIVQMEEPAINARKVPTRNLTIPIEVADPLSYNADAAFSVNINRGSSGNVTNDGNYATPLTVTFVGPLTNPQLDGPGGSSNRIKLKNSDGTDFVISSGDSVTVVANPATETGVTITDNSGANQYSAAANFTARVAQPGTSSWALSGDAGSGHATVTVRDAWYGN